MPIRYHSFPKTQMKTRFYAIASAALALTLTCTSSRRDRSWDMLAVGLPHRVSPDLAILNMGFYLLKQTHEPLFRMDMDGSVSSKVLTHWERSPDSKSFTLCPSEGAAFDADSPFDTAFLKRYLMINLPKVGLRANVRTEGRCVHLDFQRGGDRFLGEFSKMELAPTLPTENPKIELGLGSYRADSVEQDVIHLVRKHPRAGGFDEIHMYAFQGPEDPRLKDRGIEDFNRVYVDQLPAWLASDYIVRDVALLQSIVLLIDHPNKSVRRRVYHCIDIKELRRAYMPKQTGFHDIRSILPLGVEGASGGQAAQDCAQTTPTTSHPLVFVNWKKGNRESLSNYLSRFEERTHLTVSISTLTESDFATALISSPRPFNLSIVAFDAVKPDYDSFFGPFSGDPVEISDYHSLRVRAAYKDLKIASEEQEIQRAVSNLNQLLADEAWALPLYQEVRRFYYPKGLRGLSLGENFVEYPEIAGISF